MPLLCGTFCLINKDTNKDIRFAGNADQQTALEAVNCGQVFRFLNKFCLVETLVPALEHGLKHYVLLRTDVFSQRLALLAVRCPGRAE